MIAAARSMHFSNAFDSHFEYSSKQRSLRQLFSSNRSGRRMATYKSRANFRLKELPGRPSAGLPLAASCQPLALKQRRRKFYRHSEIRAAESLDDGKRHSDYSALPVQQRPAGATRSRLRIVDDLVGQHVADVPLRHERPDQFPLCQFGQHQIRFAARELHDVPNGILPRACQDGV